MTTGNMKAITLLSISLIAAALSACTVVPGSDYSHSPGWFSEDEGADPESLPDIIRVHQISTTILNDPDTGTATGTPEGLESASEDYDYEVGPGDVLNVTVWDHPELTIPAGSQRSSTESGNWVHNDGTIFYPYVGTVEVAGLNVNEIRAMITRRLGQYIENPRWT